MRWIDGRWFPKKGLSRNDGRERSRDDEPLDGWWKPSDAGEAAAMADVALDLERWFDALPLRKRRIAEMRREGHSFAAIGAALGISCSRSKQLWDQAISGFKSR